MIISEPLGTFLVNERMLETYVIARDKFLKPEGRMFPNKADLCIMPFTDQEIIDEQLSKCTFWEKKNYYGLNLSCLTAPAVVQKFQ